MSPLGATDNVHMQCGNICAKPENEVVNNNSVNGCVYSLAVFIYSKHFSSDSSYFFSVFQFKTTDNCSMLSMLSEPVLFVLVTEKLFLATKNGCLMTSYSRHGVQIIVSIIQPCTFLDGFSPNWFLGLPHV